MSKDFPSLFDVGDPVYITDGKDNVMEGHVRVAIFTNAKVRYSVSIEMKNEGGGTSTLHNIDSILVVAREGEKADFGLDNYS